MYLCIIHTFCCCLSVTITATHHAILVPDFRSAVYNFCKTILLAFSFTCLQVLSMLSLRFLFLMVFMVQLFMATGFHGAHVIIGTLFITVCLFRTVTHHFTSRHHVGFEAAAWYWHL